MNSAVQESSESAGSCDGLCSFGRSASSADLETRLSSGWASASIKYRLRVLRSARHKIAAQAEQFVAAISRDLPRTESDTVVSELLPLLDACKFLEKNASALLAPRRLGGAGRPFWLRGVSAEVHREPLGHVLVIGPANFPLFLPGVQVLQALAAGNTVTWKPGKGGAAVAELFASALRESGLPDGSLRVTDESVTAAQQALNAAPDKVVFTGSATVGHEVLRHLAEAATPAVVELSGADAVVVMPGANLETAARAIAFGLRLNGGQVCMSPRRVFADAATMAALKPLLAREVAMIPPVPLNETIAAKLNELCVQAEAMGAKVQGEVSAAAQSPILIEDAMPTMEVTRSDIFAPVVSLIALPSLLQLPEAYAACPFALTVAIFCARSEEAQARAFGKILRAGTVLINDLIAPTADPRVPFGGRGSSGYGTTRGAEGLLEMTAVKTVLVRRGGKMRHLEPTTDAQAPMFAGLLRAVHGGTLRERWHGMRVVIAEASKTKSGSKEG